MKILGKLVPKPLLILSNSDRPLSDVKLSDCEPKNGFRILLGFVEILIVGFVTSFTSQSAAPKFEEYRFHSC